MAATIAERISLFDSRMDLPEAFVPDFCVRNTFIDCATSRRPSLEDFLPRSRCFSAPSPVIGVRMRHVSTIEAVSEEEAFGWDGSEGSTSSSSISLPQSFQCETGTFASACARVHSGVGGTDQLVSFPIIGNDRHTFSAPIAHGGFTSPYTIASLSMPNAETYSKDVATTPFVGQLLSAGSVDHGAGACKPCAWYHSAKGCQTGTSCKFCHTCAPGELKRRKKEKNMLLAAQKETASL